MIEFTRIQFLNKQVVNMIINVQRDLKTSDIF